MIPIIVKYSPRPKELQLLLWDAPLFPQLPSDLGRHCLRHQDHHQAGEHSHSPGQST